MQSSKLQYILTYMYANTRLSEHQSMHMHCACAMTSAVNYVALAPCHWGIRKLITNAWLIVWSSLLRPPMLLVSDTWVAWWSKAVIVTMVWIILSALIYPNKFNYPNRRRNWLALCCLDKWGCTVFVSLSDSRFETFVSPSESSDARPGFETFCITQCSKRFWNFCITEWNKVLKLLYHRVKQSFETFVSQSETTFCIAEWRKFLYHRVTQGLKHFVPCKLKETEYIYLTDNIWPLPPHTTWHYSHYLLKVSVMC